MSTNTTILVAESNSDTARLLTDALRERGWDVLQSRDAVSAISTVLRHRPDAVVLNQMLPGGGGILTLRRIRASIHTAMTRVIAIVGSQPGDIEELRKHGADECVRIPADPAAIAAWIEKQLNVQAVVTEAPASIIRDAIRLSSLAGTGLLDSEPNDALDTLTRVTASLLGSPVALISLVDSDRQFFVSHSGLPEPWAAQRETPLSHSFCQWVVADHEALAVSDAREHPVLQHNRALHEIGVIAYAGIPLTPISGDPIGSFCAIDTKPHQWSDDDMRLLRDLASVAEAFIAVSEFTVWQKAGQQTLISKLRERSLVMQAIGIGLSRIAQILGTNNPRLTESDRQGLLSLMDSLGRQVVVIAGT